MSLYEIPTALLEESKKLETQFKGADFKELAKDIHGLLVLLKKSNGYYEMYKNSSTIKEKFKTTVSQIKTLVVTEDNNKDIHSLIQFFKNIIAMIGKPEFKGTVFEKDEVTISILGIERSVHLKNYVNGFYKMLDNKLSKFEKLASDIDLLMEELQNKNNSKQMDSVSQNVTNVASTSSINKNKIASSEPIGSNPLSSHSDSKEPVKVKSSRSSKHRSHKTEILDNTVTELQQKTSKKKFNEISASSINNNLLSSEPPEKAVPPSIDNELYEEVKEKSSRGFNKNAYEQAEKLLQKSAEKISGKVNKKISKTAKKLQDNFLQVFEFFGNLLPEPVTTEELMQSNKYEAVIMQQDPLKKNVEEPTPSSNAILSIREDNLTNSYKKRLSTEKNRDSSTNRDNKEVIKDVENQVNSLKSKVNKLLVEAKTLLDEENSENKTNYLPNIELIDDQIKKQESQLNEITKTLTVSYLPNNEEALENNHANTNQGLFFKENLAFQHINDTGHEPLNASSQEKEKSWEMSAGLIIACICIPIVGWIALIAYAISKAMESNAEINEVQNIGDDRSISPRM